MTIAAPRPAKLESEAACATSAVCEARDRLRVAQRLAPPQTAADGLTCRTTLCVPTATT